MRGVEWSDDEILHAQGLREAGYGSTQIAKILNLAHGTKRTKCAVIGMLWRIQQEARQ